LHCCISHKVIIESDNEDDNLVSNFSDGSIPEGMEIETPVSKGGMGDETATELDDSDDTGGDSMEYIKLQELADADHEVCPLV
jgi:hypothetical protein